MLFFSQKQDSNELILSVVSVELRESFAWYTNTEILCIYVYHYTILRRIFLRSDKKIPKLIKDVNFSLEYRTILDLKFYSFGYLQWADSVTDLTNSFDYKWKIYNNNKSQYHYEYIHSKSEYLSFKLLFFFDFVILVVHTILQIYLNIIFYFSRFLSFILHRTLFLQYIIDTACYYLIAVELCKICRFYFCSLNYYIILQLVLDLKWH